MNVEFLEITLSNYLSYGADTTKVALNFDKPTLIIGRNYDSVVEGQVDSNGAGKSTILNGLLMCLFDKNLMGIDKNGQINKSNGKNMMLSVSFKIDNIYYKVERYRKHKVAGGDGVRLYINDKEPVFNKEHDQTPDSVANANAEIERIIGIPYEMFIRIVVFSASHEPFLSLPSSHASKANQRDIIEELFGLTELTHKAEKLKETLSASKSEFKNLIEVNDRLLAERQRFDTQLESNIVRASDWDNSRVEKIKTLETQLGELESIDLKLSVEGFEELEKLDKELVKAVKNVPVLEAELRNVETQAKRSRLWEQEKVDTINTARMKIAELKAIDFEALFETRAKIQPLILEDTKLKGELQELYSLETAAKKEINRVVDAKLKLEIEVEHLGDNKCPYCEQDYAAAKTKIHQCEIGVEQHRIELDALHDRVTELGPQIEEKQIQLNSIASELEELRKIRIPPNLDSMQKELESYEQKLVTAESSVNPHTPAEDDLTAEDIQESLDAMKVKGDAIRNKMDMAKEFIHPSFKSMADVLNVKTRMDSLKERIEEADSEINPFRSVIKGLEEIQHEELKTDRINVLDKQMKHEDFLLKLLTKKDSFIRKALLNKNIPLLNNRLRHNLDKVGLPHKVQFTEEMEVKISQFGSDYEYGNFSAGQKARVNLCLAFAFRDVLQSRFGKINLCILDECLDTGLGDVGVKQAAKMVKAIAIENDLSMFIISHRDEVSSMFDRQLEIELRNGFSKILDDTP